MVGLASQDDPVEGPRQRGTELGFICIQEQQSQGTFGNQLAGLEVCGCFINCSQNDTLGKRTNGLHLQLSKASTIRRGEGFIIDQQLVGIQGCGSIQLVRRLGWR